LHGVRGKLVWDESETVSLSYKPSISSLTRCGSDPHCISCRHALRAKHFGSRVLFSPMEGPSLDGERAERLANTLFGAKHGGRPSIVPRMIVHEYCAL